MRLFLRLRLVYLLVSIVLVLISSLTSTSVEEEVSDANEYVLDTIGNDAPGSLSQRLKAERATCPRKINQHTTLTNIALLSLNRIKYVYEVSESGRPKVNMDTIDDVRADVIERTKSSHLGPLIAGEGMDVEHCFQDADGNCLLSLEMEGADLRGLHFHEPLPLNQISRHQASPTAEADREEMHAILKSEQQRCPVNINDHIALQQIEQIGNSRLKYHYIVSPASGVNEDNRDQIAAEVAARIKASPLAASIEKLDIGMEHYYQDPNGVCTLSLNMTREDLRNGGAKTTHGGAKSGGTTESVAGAGGQLNKTANTKVKKGKRKANKPWLPQRLKPNHNRSRDNPAGVQSNPFVD